MEKFLKYLMLMLVATFSLTFVSCGGDDDDEPDNPKNEDISTVGKLNTVVAHIVVKDSSSSHYEDVTVEVGCIVRTIISPNNPNLGGTIYVLDGEIAYAGDFDNLSSITTAPLSFRDNAELWKDNGCYIIHSVTGAYVRLKAKLSEDKESITYKFQTFVPSNI